MTLVSSKGFSIVSETKPSFGSSSARSARRASDVRPIAVVFGRQFLGLDRRPPKLRVRRDEASPFPQAASNLEARVGAGHDFARCAKFDERLVVLLFRQQVFASRES